MDRREIIRAAGAATLASITGNSIATDKAGPKTAAAKWQVPSIRRIELGNDFFLSKTNPLATADQRDLEALALKVLEMPAVIKAKEQLARRYKTIVGNQASAEAMARFNLMLEEFPVRYVQVAVNSDPNYPKVMGCLHSGPHEWFGMKFPGGRSGQGDGPDTNYIMIPIAWDAHYEVHGRRFDKTLADQSYTASGDFGISTTTAFLAALDMKINTDGTFVITLGPEPANGRANHIQTTPESRFLFIRNNRSDWRQIPDAHVVRRLDPPTGPPLTIEQIANRAAWYMMYDVSNNYMLVRYMTTIEQNTTIGPFKAVALGGLESQRAAMGYLKLADDEAFVITLSGNVPYHSITLFDYWFRSFDYWNHTSNLNNAQGADNPDGSTTYVVSIQDPGVHNWLDPVGYHEPVFWVRWQGRRWTAGETPWAKSQLVKLNDIDRVLPADMKRVTPEERKQQLAEREATYKLRFAV